MITQRGFEKFPDLSRPQARLGLSPAVFLRRSPRLRVDLATRLVVLASGVVLLQWPLLVIGVLLLIWPARQFVKVQRLLSRGYPSAAKVVSLEPPLIACVAELSYVVKESHPVLQIQAADLSRESHKMERGDRIAVVTRPRDGTITRAERLEVLVVSTVTDADLAEVMETIPEWHWDDLDDGLFRIEQPYRTGMYDLSQR